MNVCVLFNDVNMYREYDYSSVNRICPESIEMGWNFISRNVQIQQLLISNLQNMETWIIEQVSKGVKAKFQS